MSRFGFSKLFLATALLGAVPSAYAKDLAYGLGWSNKHREAKLYRVDLDSGLTSELVALQGVSAVTTGAFDIDSVTGNAILVDVGHGDGDSIVLVLSESRAAFRFAINEFEPGRVIGRVFIRPSDGAIFITSKKSGASSSREVFRVTLDTSNGAATLSLVGEMKYDFTSIDGVKMGSDGKIYALGTDKNQQSLVVFDTVTSQSESSSLPNTFDFSDLFACQTGGGGKTSLYATALPPIDGEPGVGAGVRIVDLTDPHAIEIKARISSMSEYLAGSTSCGQGKLRFLRSESESVQIKRPDFQPVTTHLKSESGSSSEISMFYLKDVVNAADDSVPMKVLAKKTQKIRAIDAKSLNRCGSNSPQLKSKSIRSTAKSIVKLKARRNRCNKK